jgi:YD repeat-containing protein
MTTSKSYDTLDRLTGIISTVAGATTPFSGFNYTYNAANERVRADVATDGSHWTYGYDGLGQVTLGSRQWSDNSAVAASSSATASIRLATGPVRRLTGAKASIRPTPSTSTASGLCREQWT